MTANKFKFKLKITGFELEVEGTKEDVAAITSTVSNQLKGLTTPPVISESNEVEDIESTDLSLPSHPLTIAKKRPTRKSKPSSASNTKPIKQEAIDYKNDSSKYNSPTMKWSTLQKSLWILYVVNNENKISELTTTQIAETFNKHHKQSKVIRPSNVSRDFGRVKQGQKALVGENTTVNPNSWYLTSEGIKTVHDLIKGIAK